MHELVSPDSAIDPLVTSQLGVCCKRTSVSHLVVKLHRLYRCRLVLQTPYACSPAMDGSVPIVAGRECIVVVIVATLLIYIFGWVLTGFGSGVNRVTVDFGADINNELFRRKRDISVR